MENRLDKDSNKNVVVSHSETPIGADSSSITTLYSFLEEDLDRNGRYMVLLSNRDDGKPQSTWEMGFDDLEKAMQMVGTNFRFISIYRIDEEENGFVGEIVRAVRERDYGDSYGLLGNDNASGFYSNLSREDRSELFGEHRVSEITDGDLNRGCK